MDSTVQRSKPVSSEQLAATSRVSQWHARLEIKLKKSARGTVVKHSEHKGPLYIQKAFYPEGRDVAHLYILHPPGGLVSGDNLQINIEAEAQAQVLVTTPGAGRVYKARADRSLQQQKVTLSAAQGACIEWLPLETILYPDANARLDTQVKLEAGASFIGWDILCLGLAACQQPFERGSLQQCLQIEIGGRIKLRERIILNDSNRELLSESVGFANRSVNALLVAGPFAIADDALETDSLVIALIDKLRQHCLLAASTIIESRNKQLEQAPLCSVSLSGEFLLVRYLGDDAEQARLLFTQCWNDIRPLLLKREACAPRIWST